MFKEISQVGKHSAIYGVGQILQRLVGFLLIPMYTLYFTTSDYGIQEILYNTSSILTTLLSLGLISGMYRSYFMYEDEKRRNNVARTAMSVYVVSSALVGGILIVFARPLSALILPDQSYSHLLVLTLIFIIMNNFIAVPFAVLRAKSQSTRFVVFSLVQFLANIAGTVYLVAVMHRGVQGSLEGNLIGQVAVLLLFIPSFLELFKGSFSRVDLKEMLTFGLPLVPALLASISLSVSDRYFLRAYSTFDEIGVYGLGYKIGLLVQVLVVTPFSLSWGPVMWSVADKPFAKQFYSKVMTYFTAVALYMALIVSILSPELIRLMSQRQSYWRAWEVVPLITLSYVLYGMYSQLAIGINLKKKTQYLPFLLWGAAGLNLLLNFLLIPSWGMMGAAASTLASYFVLSVLVYFASQRLYPFKYEWDRLLKLSLFFILCFGASFLIPPTSIWITIGIKLILLLIFPMALFAVRFFTPAELSRGKELVTMGFKKLSNQFHPGNVPESRN